MTVHDGEGAAVQSELAIRVEDSGTGTPLIVRHFFDRETWPYRLELPEGRYRLVVEGKARVGEQHGMVWAARGHGRFATTIHVVAGRDTMVQATLPKGARVHVRLTGKEREEDREATGASMPDWRFRLFDENDGPERASLALFTDGGWPEPIRFRIGGKFLTSELALGSEQTSEILPAGRFRVEARLPDGRVVSRTVVLVDGETTAVDLSFE